MGAITERMSAPNMAFGVELSSLALLSLESVQVTVEPRNEMLPLELTHEPYSEESHPCLLLPNARRFLFEVSEDGNRSYCVVGHTVIRGSGGFFSSPKPVKKTSYVSVGAIYDNYGLETTLFYLSNLDVLYYHACIYLHGSALDLGLVTVITELDVLDLRRLIVRELERIDSTKPKMKGELVPGHVSFPPELVAKMVNSNCISKQVTACLEKWEMPLLPRLRRELGWEGSRREGVVIAHSDTRWLVYRSGERQMRWGMIDQQGQPMLVHKKTASAQSLIGGVVEFSLDIYDIVLGKKERTNAMLEEMKLRLLTPGGMGRDEIRTWLVQLSYGTKVSGKRLIRFRDDDGMHSRLMKLINRALDMRR